VVKGKTIAQIRTEQGIKSNEHGKIFIKRINNIQPKTTDKTSLNIELIKSIFVNGVNQNV